MGWQSVFQNIEQPRTGQFIEELVRMDVVRKPFKLALLQPIRAMLIVHSGWRPSWAVCLGGTNSMPGRQLLKQNQKVSGAHR